MNLRGKTARSLIGAGAIGQIALGLACLLLLAGAAPGSAAVAPPAQLSFQGETVDTQLSDPDVVMAIGSDGLPQLAYQKLSAHAGHSTELRYARWTGAAWLRQRVAGTELGGDVSMALDSRDRPHISFSACDPFACPAQLVRWTGEQWALDPTVVGAGRLALDAADRAHIAYRDGDLRGALDLRYAHQAEGRWISATVASDLDRLRWLDIALDSQGRPRIAYYAAGALSYSAWENESWATTVVANAPDAGLALMLKLDPADRPHLSYYDNGAGLLRYATRAPGGWVSETVDRVGASASITGLALDDQGRPRIAYYDATLGAVKYARRTATGWQIFVVAAGLSAPPGIALGLDQQGRPLVAYSFWDAAATSRSLILARGRPASAPTPVPAPAPAIYLPAVSSP